MHTQKCNIWETNLLMQECFASLWRDESSSSTEVKCNSLPNVRGEGVVLHIGSKMASDKEGRISLRCNEAATLHLQARINIQGNHIENEKLMNGLNAQYSFFDSI